MSSRCLKALGGHESSCDDGGWEEQCDPTSICSSRSSGALAGDVGRNPLLATFVLCGNPFENLQVLCFFFAPGGALAYANDEHSGGQPTGRQHFLAPASWRCKAS